jgi:hypothetical protein
VVASNVVSLPSVPFEETPVDDVAHEVQGLLAIGHTEAGNRNIGWALEPRDWLAAKQRRAELDDQTERLADLLEASGVEARMTSDVVAISAVTGIVTELNAWRPIRFLPAVAARDRRPMLNELRYWVDNEAERPEYIRYAVVTAGDLVPAFGDLRGALQGLARRVSKWAADARELYDVEVHFRGSEFTRKTAAERGLADRYPAGLVLYHPHANVLFQPLRKLPEEGEGSWAEFLSWTRSMLDAHWHDNGRVEDVREIVKYVVKPADLLEGEQPLQADEARWLHESLFRLNLAQPLGAFRQFHRDVVKQKLKAVRVRNIYGTGGELALVSKGKKLDHSEKQKREERDVEPGGKPKNLFIGVTMPMWQHTPWAEPTILVQNYDPNPVSRAALERLQEIDYERMDARARWDASGAPSPATALSMASVWAKKGGLNVTPFRAARPASYRVHTSSLTVRNGSSATGSNSPPDRGSGRPPDPSDDRFAIAPDVDISNFKLPDLRIVSSSAR